MSDSESPPPGGLPEKFVAALGHELRTPLQVMTILIAKLMRSNTLGAAEKHDVQTLGNNVHRMNRLVTDLLDFTRGSFGSGLGVEKRPGDLHQVAAQALAELREANPGREIIHRTEGDGHGVFDADRLVQVITNLVSNAVKYGAKDQPIRVHTVGDGDDGLLVSVENKGAQIPVDAQPYLFDPFRRASDNAQRSSLGLGLAIVKSIAVAHGGSVDVESNPDGATRFQVYVPR